ncbi:MAG: bud emergence protein 1 [Alyxoria varia]|nr:MAG: bud emergence protein 1 [Alyxoria varia]
MKHFRRSTKSSDKVDTRVHHISIPQKDPLAIQPPKKVIKAKYDYQVQDRSNNPEYLSFSKGDFLHVVAKEDDEDWYEACNPVRGTRGLVPVNYFDVVGKNVRSSGGIEPVNSMNLGPAQTTPTQPDMGFQNQSGERDSFRNQNEDPTRMSRLTRHSGAMVYGIVQYDFKAERPDELEARAGEAIIVIAQSNPEWFVAKPITRLGGPGLIPVSFIEIRDMTTGEPVKDTQEAVSRAGVPKVEEWKRMAASYKNSSIPLGKLDSQRQGSERASMNSNLQPSQDANGHARNSSTHVNDVRNSQLVNPLKARVPRYCHHEEKFWFVVEAFMEDGKHWDLNREYTDFYALQTALMDQFPDAAGRTEGQKRTLPYMPGPLPWITERLTAERREHMDLYLTQLLSMDRLITTSNVVRSFFAPRDRDQVIEGTPDADQSLSESEWVRLSQGSSQQSGAYDSRQSSTGNLNNGANGYSSPPKQGQYSQQTGYGQNKQPPGHYRNTSDLRNPHGNGAPPMMYNQNSSQSGSGFLNQAGPPPSANGAPTKIKVFFGDGNCVVIRMPPSFSYNDLVQKIRSRYSLEPNVGDERARTTNFRIDYKDDISGGGYHRLSSDSDLQAAQERNDKLTLRVAVDSSY